MSTLYLADYADRLGVRFHCLVDDNSTTCSAFILDARQMLEPHHAMKEAFGEVVGDLAPSESLDGEIQMAS